MRHSINTWPFFLEAGGFQMIRKNTLDIKNQSCLMLPLSQKSNIP